MFKDSATVRAAFRRIGWIDQAYLTTSTYSLVREILLEQTPTAIQNAFAQMRVAYHIANVQIFQRHPVAGLNQRGTQLVQQVAALVLDMLMLALDGSQRLAA